MDVISIREGAELHMVIEGKDEIIARFGKKQFEKVRQQGTVYSRKIPKKLIKHLDMWKSTIIMKSI